MNTAFLLLGGNIGDRELNLRKAAHLIQQSCGTIIKSSSIYETAAWGIEHQPAFYNQTMEINTKLSAEILMQKLLFIEEEMGRKRIEKNGPRIIDIDILLMNDLIINTKTLVIPHPRLAERKFALVPLAEIAPDIIHPITKKTITEMLRDCKDVLDVYKISAKH
jgi:2-amino-4-hydroxy-6-hydroxymethyldihydropteridine diphosphokinase